MKKVSQASVLLVLIIFLIAATALDNRLGSQVQAAAPTTNLSAYWNFDQGSGNTATDLSGNNNSGTINGATWTTGQVNGALSFNGSSYVDGGTDSNFYGGSGVTVSTWVNGSILADWQTYQLLTQTRNGWPGHYQLFLNRTNSTNGKPVAQFGVMNSGFSQFTAQGTTVLQPNTWYHLVGRYNGATGEVSIWVNGVREGVVTGVGSSLTTPSTGKFTVGATENNGGSSYSNFFNGTIDEIRVYSRALTDGEVLEVYNDAGGVAPPAGGTAPSISSFSASPSSVTVGQSATLSWDVSGDPTPTVSINNGVGSVSGSNVTVSPTNTTTYTLTATNSEGSVTEDVLVNVTSGTTTSSEFTPDWFNNLSIGSFWRQHNSQYASPVESVDEQLEVIVGTDQFWFINDESWGLFQDQTGDFDIWTSVSVLAEDSAGSGNFNTIPNRANISSDHYRFGGLIAYDPASSDWNRNYVFCVQGRRGNSSASGLQFEAKSTINSSSQVDAYSVENHQRDIRLRRTGNTFECYERPYRSSDSWVLRQTYVRSDLPATLSLGPITYQMSTQGRRTLVEFDHVIDLGQGSSIPNQAPTLSVGVSQVTLFAQATDDNSPASQLSYVWSLVSGPTGAVINNVNSPNPTVTFTQDGLYEFLAEVSDGELSTSRNLMVDISSQ